MCRVGIFFDFSRGMKIETWLRVLGMKITVTTLALDITPPLIQALPLIRTRTSQESLSSSILSSSKQQTNKKLAHLKNSSLRPPATNSTPTDTAALMPGDLVPTNAPAQPSLVPGGLAPMGLSSGRPCPSQAKRDYRMQPVLTLYTGDWFISWQVAQSAAIA